MRNAAQLFFLSYEAAYMPDDAWQPMYSLPPSQFVQRVAARAGGAQGVRTSSVYRALQRPPLSGLASNGNDHAHVRAVAILGYN
jgi:hypothetical protein